MGKVVGPVFKWKSRIPKQTRWNRKNRNKTVQANSVSNATTQITEENIDIDEDTYSVTGDVLAEEHWDVSSVSTNEECEDHLYLSDDADSGSDADSTFDLPTKDLGNEIPLYSQAKVSLKESVQLTMAFARKANLSRELTDRGSDCFLGTREIRITINKRLSHCKVPTEIVRTVRNLDAITHWKASEYRTMVFIMTIVTSDILPKSYHRHFCKFANAVFILSSASCNSDSIESARKLLKAFVNGVANLYGEEYLSFNVHSLLHLADCCDNWGPLWRFSAFIFESFNAILLKYISNANGVAAQVSKKFNIDMQAKYCGQQIFKNQEAFKLFGAITKLPKLSENLFYTKPPYTAVVLSDHILQLCAIYCVPDIIYSAKSAVIGGHLFKSKETKKE